jgi:hypothetical protein
VTITGTNFTGATAVRIGTFASSSFTVASATSITMVVPSGAGSVNGFITVTTPGGTATSTTPFNIVATGLTSQVMPELQVYPNPFQDQLTVVLPAAGPAQVELRDLTGRIVLARTSLPLDRQLKLPDTLSSGVYLLEVRQGNVIAVRRVKKQ